MSKEGIKGIAVGRSDIYRMDPRDLHVKPGWNSREDTPENAAHVARLSVSIGEVGVKQPLTVYWEDGRTFVSDGHCRLAAAMLAISNGADIRSVPVQTEERYASEADRVFSQVVRNSGKPLSPIEQAGVFKRLVGFGWSEKDIAQRTGNTRAWVVELLELQAAPEAVTRLVRGGKVAATLALKTLKANKGDGEKTAAELERAVETARADGKERATARHMGGTKPSLKAELRALFDAVGITPRDGGYLVEMSDDQYATFRSLAGA